MAANDDEFVGNTALTEPVKNSSIVLVSLEYSTKR